MRVVSELWAYGPDHFQDTDLGIPLDVYPRPWPTNGPKPQDYPLDDPIHSPVNGHDILRRLDQYLDNHKRRKVSVNLHLYCGTAEVLYPANKLMVDRLRGLTQIDVKLHAVSPDSSVKRILERDRG